MPRGRFLESLPWLVGLALLSCDSTPRPPIDAAADAPTGSDRGPGKACGAVPDGGEESRHCYNAATVPVGHTCAFATQTRRCLAGAFSPDYPACANLTCSVEGSTSCGSVPHGESETRPCYDAATVPAGKTCTAAEQTRTCNDGAWSPDWPACANLTCAVSGYKSCGVTPHGSSETRDCYPSATVPAGSSCVPVQQTRTCDDGVWSPDWPSCPSLNCTILAQASASYAGDGPDVLGLNAACDVFAADPVCGYGGDAAFASCERALVLAKNNGVSWVRWGLPWHYFTDGVIPIPQCLLDFVKRVLGAARSRGMKILFQLALPAPGKTYKPAAPASQLLDFSDTAFDAWIDTMLEVTRPYTRHYELFNEVNWGGESIFIDNDPSPTDNPRARLVSRMKELYDRTRSRMAAATAKYSDFAPQLLSSGISYFDYTEVDQYRTSPPLAAGDPLIGSLAAVGAHNYVQDLGATYLNNVIDQVAVHPYFSPAGTSSAKLAAFRQTVNTVSGKTGKPIWVTETGWACCDPVSAACCPLGTGCCWPSSNQGADFVADLMSAVAAGSIQKLFWFTTFSWLGEVDDSGLYGIYSQDGWSIKRPALASTLFEQARKVPFDQRFSAPSASAPVQLDLAALAPTASYTVNGSQAQSWGGSRAGAFSGTAEDASSPAGLRFTLDDTINTIEATFANLAVPASGIPTLRLSFGFASTVAAGTPLAFDVWIIGGQWPGKQRFFPYQKSRDGKLQTEEIDLSQVRGTSITVQLRPRRVSTLGAGKTVDALFVAPRVIDRTK